MSETSANNNAVKLIRNVKVYFDGSSYIAIPHTTRPKGKTKRHSFDPNKQDFENAYAEAKGLPKKERKKAIIEKLNDIVPNAKEYVDISLERKNRNRIAKRTRLWRKARLQCWNYFCTVTHFYGCSIYNIQNNRMSFTMHEDHSKLNNALFCLQELRNGSNTLYYILLVSFACRRDRVVSQLRER